jgi:Ca2+:H+ antiporter
MLVSNARAFVKSESVNYRRLKSQTSVPGVDEDEESLFRPIPESEGNDEVEPSHAPLSSELKGIASDFAALKIIAFSSWLNLLLIAIPLTFVSHYSNWGAESTFILSFTSLIPLALILGDVTEDLAVRFGDIVGGLMNATFGNVVEVLISLAALQKNLFTVISTSLMGSILSNLLLVLGFCFLCGGVYYKTQTWNAIGSRACSSLLMLSCLGIVLPTASVLLVEKDPGLSFAQQTQYEDEFVLSISRGTAVVLLVCYVCYLVFQLKTHHDLFTNSDEEDEPIMSLPFAIGVLAVITVIVAVCSEFLTGSIEEVSNSTGISQKFIGIIVLPIAGNAVFCTGRIGTKIGICSYYETFE